MTDMKRIREALCLFKSMVDGGERASQTSSEAFENAMGDSLAVDAELTALRAEVERLKGKWASSNQRCPQCGCGIVPLQDAERKAIAEAVRQVCSNDTAQLLADRIEEGEVK
jgi:hypothetical protein